MKRNYLIIFLPMWLVGLFFVGHEVLAKVPTPQIYNVVHSTDNSYRPWVIGWTPNEVEVEILLDDVSQGLAKVVKDKSGTASFGWSPQHDLPLGWHEFRVKGKYNNQYSEPGGVIGYQVSPPTPAPTIFEPEDMSDYILIKGLIKNDSVVQIYIDDLLAADFSVPNHPSGTTNFWFKARGLLNGVHEVYAVAIDNTGKPSKKSKLISFKTEQQKITSGESSAEITSQVKTDDTTSTGRVIDEPLPCSVKVNDSETEGEVKIENLPSETERIINIGESATIGEISSVSEDLSEDLITTTSQATERETENRWRGLVLLGIVTIILYAWYFYEIKKAKQKKE